MNESPENRSPDEFCHKSTNGHQEAVAPRTEAPVDKSADLHSDQSDRVVSVFKVIGLALLVASLIVSLLINFSLGIFDSNGAPSGDFQWIVIAGLLIITAISLSVNFWLFYVRSIYLRDGPALVPEKWGRILVNLTDGTKKSSSSMLSGLQKVMEASRFQSQKSEELVESFLTLQSVISNRDEEIARLRKGHDAKVFKRFLKGFIRVSIALEEIFEEEHIPDHVKNYRFLYRKIQNALEDCGVEVTYPEIGADYRELGDEVDDDPEMVVTEDSALDYKIESVISPAYVIVGEGDMEVIVPARVKIHQLKAIEEKSS